MTEDTEEITDHWGRHYRSLEDLCRAYNVPVAVFLSRKGKRPYTSTVPNQDTELNRSAELNSGKYAHFRITRFTMGKRKKYDNLKFSFRNLKK